LRAYAVAENRQISEPACRAIVAGEEFWCDFSGLLIWPDERIAIVADLHLEKGSSFAARGSMLPPYDTAVTLAALAVRIAHWNPRTVVALGDSFHDAKASERLPDEYRSLLAGIMAGRDWVWISGNHDPEPPADLGGSHASELAIGGIVLRHEPSASFAPGEIAGHLHPQARIVRRGKAVRRPCFATDGARMVMPAFGAFTGGLNLRDKAFEGLFDATRLHAHMLGRERIYTIGGRMLV